MPEANVQPLRFHRRRARFHARVARRRHFRAAVLARRSLAAQSMGRPVQARRLMRAALNTKARAGRAGLRAQFHRNRMTAIRNARAQHS
jgi:hypothetical protein